jgi:Protein kinase domain
LVCARLDKTLSTRLASIPISDQFFSIFFLKKKKIVGFSDNQKKKKKIMSESAKKSARQKIRKRPAAENGRPRRSGARKTRAARKSSDAKRVAKKKVVQEKKVSQNDSESSSAHDESVKSEQSSSADENSSSDDQNDSNKSGASSSSQGSGSDSNDSNDSDDSDSDSDSSDSKKSKIADKKKPVDAPMQRKRSGSGLFSFFKRKSVGSPKTSPVRSNSGKGGGGGMDPFPGVRTTNVIDPSSSKEDVEHLQLKSSPRANFGGKRGSAAGGSAAGGSAAAAAAAAATNAESERRKKDKERERERKEREREAKAAKKAAKKKAASSSAAAASSGSSSSRGRKKSSGCPKFTEPGEDDSIERNERGNVLRYEDTSIAFKTALWKADIDPSLVSTPRALAIAMNVARFLKVDRETIQYSAERAKGSHNRYDAEEASKLLIEGEAPEKKYEIIEQVGQGAFGKVFVADVIGSDKSASVAVKRMPHTQTSEKANILNELRFLTRCKHECIVDFHEAYLVDGGKEAWMIMENMEGGTLREAQRGYEEGHIAFVARSILRALAYMHSNGMVHRDLKRYVHKCKRKKERAKEREQTDIVLGKKVKIL